VVDRAALDSGQFKEWGGFTRIDRVFEGELEQIIGEITERIWQV
jgi:type I restriction enzyme R subunit